MLFTFTHAFFRELVPSRDMVGGRAEPLIAVRPEATGMRRTLGASGQRPNGLLQRVQAVGVAWRGIALAEMWKD
jgi:hypothetical protein